MVAQDTVSLLFLAFVGIACVNSIREGDNAVLTCMVPKPDGTSEPEPRRRIGLEPGEPGTVWLPKESGYRMIIKIVVYFQSVSSFREVSYN